MNSGGGNPLMMGVYGKAASASYSDERYPHFARKQQRLVG